MKKLLTIIALPLFLLTIFFYSKTAYAQTATILNPVADTYVNKSSSGTNYGTQTTITVDGNPVKIAYLKFDLTSFAGATIQSAKLRLKITNASTSTQRIKTVSNTSWSETGTTYSNRPALGSTIATTTGGTVGTWKEIDITSSVAAKSGGLYSLGIDSSGGDDLVFNSRENAGDKVELVIETVDPAPTPTAAVGQMYDAGYQNWNGSFDGGNNNIISATQVTTGAIGGISQSISIYMGSVTASPNNHIQVGIYADNGSNNPGTLLGSSATQVITPNSWNTVPLPNVTISPNTKYFVAFNLDGGTTQFGWNSTTTGISRWKFNVNFGTWPSSFGTPTNSANQQYAIYLTYTGSPTPTPTATPTSTPTPPTSTCNVPGGTSTNPANLSNTINTQTNCTEFILGDGYYSPTVISRNAITVRAANVCAAHVQPELTIDGQDVTVDGVSITGDATGITVYKPGAQILNNCIQGFGKQNYANGIWVVSSALDPNNKVIIQGNKLDDWGGVQFAGGIAIGHSNDNYSIPATVSVEVRNNRITNGPTTAGVMSAAIQSFHPFLAYKNFIDTVEGSAVQNKTFGSQIACNEAVHVTGDAALYNRLNSNNVWEYNKVHDSFMGIDHFMGDGTVFRGNVIYNNEYLGRVKDQDVGSTNVTFENNTFYWTTGWAGFIWDNSTGGTISNILWKDNIFQNINQFPIVPDPALDAAWDEYGNIFFNTIKPTGTTGGLNGSSIVADPQFVNPPFDFTAQNSAVQGKGAPWPLPCQ